MIVNRLQIILCVILLLERQRHISHNSIRSVFTTVYTVTAYCGIYHTLYLYTLYYIGTYVFIYSHKISRRKQSDVNSIQHLVNRIRFDHGNFVYLYLL